jgi:hypothetical protein
MKPLWSGINVSTNAGSNARTSPDFPDQQKQLTGRSRLIDVVVSYDDLHASTPSAKVIRREA